MQLEEVSPQWIAPWVVVKKMTQYIADTSLADGFRPYLGAAFGGFLFGVVRRAFNFVWEVHDEFTFFLTDFRSCQGNF